MKQSIRKGKYLLKSISIIITKIVPPSTRESSLCSLHRFLEKSEEVMTTPRGSKQE